MNIKIKKTWKDNPGPVNVAVVHEKNNAIHRSHHKHPHGNGQSTQIDPKILQRYSLDDNGGSYKGL